MIMVASTRSNTEQGGLFEGPSLHSRRGNPQPSSTLQHDDTTCLDPTQTSKPDLLSRLPAEVRHMVYDLVIQPKTYHITSKSDTTTLATHTCKNLSSKSPHHPHCAIGKGQRLDHSLSLLFVNKQTHNEVCPIIYSQSAFTFLDMKTMVKVLNAVTTENWHRIRDLRFILLLQRHPNLNGQTARDWREMWETLRDMRGLRDVYVQLSMFKLVRQRVLRQEEDEAEWFGDIARVARVFEERGGLLDLKVVVLSGCLVRTERIDLGGDGKHQEETEAYQRLLRHLRSHR